MPRRDRSSEGSGGEGGHDGGGSLRWLLTYADMITLLMAFFIMMYSMSILNIAKFSKVAFSIRSGFGGVTPGQGKSVLGTSGQFSAKPSPITGDSAGVPWAVVQKVQRFVKEQELESAVRMYTDRRGLVISVVTDKFLFPRGAADLPPASHKVLRAIGDAIKDIPNDVQVVGHTCNLPISSNKYPSNLDLSTARAATVWHFLVGKCHISPERLSASGYGEFRPAAPNTSEKNRAINRRVEIVIVSNTGGNDETERQGQWTLREGSRVSH